MADEERTVVISDARYENPTTGEVHTSKVFHIMGLGCLQNSPHRLEVPESTALAFGRTLCGTCANTLKRLQAAAKIEEALADLFTNNRIRRPLR